MEECNAETISTTTGSLVDKTNALLVAHCESLAYAILNLESYMVNTLAAIVEELLDGAIGTCGLKKLNLNLTNLQESGLNLLVLNNLTLIIL